MKLGEIIEELEVILTIDDFGALKQRIWELAKRLNDEHKHDLAL